MINILHDEFVDRYTPEIARHEGHVAGMEKQIERTIAFITTKYQKPTKQTQELLVWLENNKRFLR
jgi:hypothetical protein